VTMDSKKISFSEELLSGYLDGELSEEEAEKVHQFALSSSDIREDLSSLANVGQILSSNFKSMPADLNIWQAIEGKISAKTPNAVGMTPARQVKPEIRRVSGIWSLVFSPGYAAALAVGLFAVGMISSQWVELPENNNLLSKVDLQPGSSKITESDIPIQTKEILVPLIQKNRASTGQTFVSNGFPPEQTIDFNYSPQFISPQQLGLEHPARGAGVRSDGMQIDWMKHSKDVRFLRHKNDSLPPTIWLGELR